MTTKKIIGGHDMWGNMMATQMLLDRKIQKEHEADFDMLGDERILALQAEIMEYANETRCFKYWSHKAAAPFNVRLEEFVDGIHFYLSFFNSKRMSIDEVLYMTEQMGVASPAFIKEKNKRITFHVQQAMSWINKWHDDLQKSKTPLMNSFAQYWRAGVVDGFTPADIEKMYYIKNSENHERQKTGY